MTDIHLRGMTWNHTRGFVPMVATAQRFHERNPHVHITWEKRSLQAFADAPIEGLAEQYDLIVIDHPHAGVAQRSGVLLNLHDHLAGDFMADQAANSVGHSHASYDFDGYQCALAIDAATPVASYRPDMIESAPTTWDDLIAMAKAGQVLVPAIPIDSLMNFYMMCIANGETPFQSDERLVSESVGIQALEQFRELVTLCDPMIFNMNPIKVYNYLSSAENIHAAYCPFAYGYVNYARDGYAVNRLAFANVVQIAADTPTRTTLGGTGLAISSRCEHVAIASAYAQYVAGGDTQRTLYFESGGQPGHRSAWTDARLNERCHQGLANTLETLDNAYLRPRYDGYMHFQDHAGDLVRDYLMTGADVRGTLAGMNRLYLESLKLKHN